MNLQILAMACGLILAVPFPVFITRGIVSAIKRDGKWKGHIGGAVACVVVVFLIAAIAAAVGRYG